jgi:hypothetical protein
LVSLARIVPSNHIAISVQEVLGTSVKLCETEIKENCGFVVLYPPQRHSGSDELQLSEGRGREFESRRVRQ